MMQSAKHFLKRAIIIFLPVMAGLCIGASVNRRDADTGRRPPNILFIFADDQRADALGAAGNRYIHTPHIDALARNGTRLDNAYVMGGHHGAVCAPSRAMLMSGKSLFHVYDVLDGVYTMPQHFAKHGYETFATGKWHNGAKAFEASFQKGKAVFLGGMSDHGKVPVRDMGENGRLGEVRETGYSTDVFTGAAIEYLDDYARRKTEAPFFCYVAYTAPHDPREPKEDYRGLYPDGALPVPGNFRKYHPFAFDNMQIRDEQLAAWPRTPEIIQASLSDYYALISHMDAKIGEIITLLKAKGLYENTLIVYTADNGLAIGSHGLLGKQNLYEHSTKVPMILAGPGIPENKVSEALVYLFDLFPTLAAASGLPAPKGIDGESFLPLLQQPQQRLPDGKGRTSLFTVYRNTVRAVRDKDFKLIRYPLINRTQLFSLNDDPLELNDLAGKPAYAEKERAMMELLGQWQRQTDDTARLQVERLMLPDYQPETFRQSPDQHQPPYVLERYFKRME